jgi:hypothetical protein
MDELGNRVVDVSLHSVYRGINVINGVLYGPAMPGWRALSALQLMNSAAWSAMIATGVTDPDSGTLPSSWIHLVKPHLASFTSRPAHVYLSPDGAVVPKYSQAITYERWRRARSIPTGVPAQWRWSPPHIKGPAYATPAPFSTSPLAVPATPNDDGTSKAVVGVMLADSAKTDSSLHPFHTIAAVVSAQHMNSVETLRDAFVKEALPSPESPEFASLTSPLLRQLAEDRARLEEPDVPELGQPYMGPACGPHSPGYFQDQASGEVRCNLTLGMLVAAQSALEFVASDGPTMYCQCCREGGSIVCCSHCSSSWHELCEPDLAVSGVPASQWMCRFCTMELRLRQMLRDHASARYKVSTMLMKTFAERILLQSRSDLSPSELELAVGRLHSAFLSHVSTAVGTTTRPRKLNERLLPRDGKGYRAISAWRPWSEHAGLIIDGVAPDETLPTPFVPLPPTPEEVGARVLLTALLQITSDGKLCCGMFLHPPNRETYPDLPEAAPFPEQFLDSLVDQAAPESSSKCQTIVQDSLLRALKGTWREFIPFDSHATFPEPHQHDAPPTLDAISSWAATMSAWVRRLYHRETFPCEAASHLKGVIAHSVKAAGTIESQCQKASRAIVHLATSDTRLSGAPSLSCLQEALAVGGAMAPDVPSLQVLVDMIIATERALDSGAVVSADASDEASKVMVWLTEAADQGRFHDRSFTEERALHDNMDPLEFTLRSQGQAIPFHNSHATSAHQVAVELLQLVKESLGFHTPLPGFLLPSARRSIVAARQSSSVSEEQDLLSEPGVPTEPESAPLTWEDAMNQAAAKPSSSACTRENVLSLVGSFTSPKSIEAATALLSYPHPEAAAAARFGLPDSQKWQEPTSQVASCLLLEAAESSTIEQTVQDELLVAEGRDSGAGNDWLLSRALRVYGVSTASAVDVSARVGTKALAPRQLSFLQFRSLSDLSHRCEELQRQHLPGPPEDTQRLVVPIDRISPVEDARALASDILSVLFPTQLQLQAGSSHLPRALMEAGSKAFSHMLSHAAWLNTQSPTTALRASLMTAKRHGAQWFQPPNALSATQGAPPPALAQAILSLETQSLSTTTSSVRVVASSEVPPIFSNMPSAATLAQGMVQSCRAGIASIVSLVSDSEPLQVCHSGSSSLSSASVLNKLAVEHFEKLTPDSDGSIASLVPSISRLSRGDPTQCAGCHRGWQHQCRFENVICRLLSDASYMSPLDCARQIVLRMVVRAAKRLLAQLDSLAVDDPLGFDGHILGIAPPRWGVHLLRSLRGHPALPTPVVACFDEFLRVSPTDPEPVPSEPVSPDGRSSWAPPDAAVPPSAEMLQWAMVTCAKVVSPALVCSALDSLSSYTGASMDQEVWDALRLCVLEHTPPPPPLTIVPTSVPEIRKRPREESCSQPPLATKRVRESQSNLSDGVSRVLDELEAAAAGHRLHDTLKSVQAEWSATFSSIQKLLLVSRPGVPDQPTPTEPFASEANDAQVSGTLPARHPRVQAVRRQKTGRFVALSEAIARSFLTPTLVRQIWRDTGSLPVGVFVREEYTVHASRELNFDELVCVAARTAASRPVTNGSVLDMLGVSLEPRAECPQLHPVSFTGALVHSLRNGLWLSRPTRWAAQSVVLPPTTSIPRVLEISMSGWDWQDHPAWVVDPCHDGWEGAQSRVLDQGITPLNEDALYLTKAIEQLRQASDPSQFPLPTRAVLLELVAQFRRRAASHLVLPPSDCGVVRLEPVDEWHARETTRLNFELPETSKGLQPHASLLAPPAASGMVRGTVSELPPPTGPEIRQILRLQPERLEKLVPISLLSRRAQWNSKKLRCGTSKIDGVGLFAMEDILADDVIIEYVGEVLSEQEADERCARYGAAGLADYMFRVGEDTVIDATVRGGRARYMNHSCEPNCFAVATVPESQEDVRVLGILGGPVSASSSSGTVHVLPSGESPEVTPTASELSGDVLTSSVSVFQASSRDAPPALGVIGESAMQRRVFIYASRNIHRGEEITYDYQFAPEATPIPCRCGTRSCRGTLNLPAGQ